MTSRCKKRGLKKPCQNPVVPGRKLCAYHIGLKAGVATPTFLVERCGLKEKR